MIFVVIRSYEIIQLERIDMPNDIGDANGPHEGKVADAIDAHMQRTSNNAAIPDLAAPKSRWICSGRGHCCTRQDQPHSRGPP